MTINFHTGTDELGRPVRLRSEGGHISIMPDDDDDLTPRRKKANKNYVYKREQLEPTPDVWMCELPLPPSVNHLFPTVGKRRMKSMKYKTWLAVALPILKALPRWQGGYPIKVRMVIQEKIHGNCDIANFEKATCDSLVSAGIIHNDTNKFITENTQRYEPGTGHGVRVEIREDVG